MTNQSTGVGMEHIVEENEQFNVSRMLQNCVVCWLCVVLYCVDHKSREESFHRAGRQEGVENEKVRLELT